MSLLTSGQAFLSHRHPRTVDPTRDWLTIVFCSILAFIVIVVWNAWAFDRIASGKILGAPPGGQVAATAEFSIEEVEAIFDARAEEMWKYQQGEYSFTDPSK